MPSTSILAPRDPFSSAMFCISMQIATRRGRAAFRLEGSQARYQDEMVMFHESCKRPWDEAGLDFGSLA